MCADKVYPRVCGGTIHMIPDILSALGLSPRVRGNLLSTCAKSSPSGSIPACAGEPWSVILSQLRFGVYPRVCGGTPGPVVDLFSAKGLSPRVRGNPEQERF